MAGCTKCKEKRTGRSPSSPSSSNTMASHNAFLERELARYRKEEKMFREREMNAKRKADQAAAKVKELTDKMQGNKKDVDVKNPFSKLLKDKG